MNHIAIFGGTFDPIHNGHLFVAEEICSKFHINRLFFVVANISPFKTNQRATPAKLRYEMLKHAIKDRENMSVSDFEIQRSGVSYSIDTIQHFHDIFPDDKLFFIIGADHADSFDKWLKYREIVDLCDIIVIARENFFIRNIQKIVPFEKLHVVDTKTPNVSSSEIRNRLDHGESVDDLVPPSVGAFIKKHNLYQPCESVNHIIKKLPLYFNNYRLQHTLSVAEEAVKLAKIYGADPDKAFLAALLHDCAKAIEHDESILKKYDIKLDDMDRACPSVIHQIVGEAMAYFQFHIYDNEILHAIRYHTTGCTAMPLMSKIVFVADCIEPNRNYKGVDEIRKYAYTDLNKAILISIENTVSHLLEQQKPIHVDTILTYNYYVNKENLNG